MALTLEALQRLTKVSLVDLFTKSQPEWTRLAEHSYKFVRDEFPKDASVRPDDVARALVPLLKVNDKLKTYLSTNKLREKYWITDFGDLILDRSWNKITEGRK